MRRIVMGGFGNGHFPYFAPPEVAMQDQSDYGLASIITGALSASDAEVAEAKAAWLTRFHDIHDAPGNPKGWALSADRIARLP